MKAQSAGVRRIGVGLAAAATLVTSACAAGQIAQTANQKPTLDGTEINVGQMALRGIAIAPPPASSASFPKGSDLSLRIVMVNAGQRTDKLTAIKTPVTGGWSATGSSGSQSVTIPAGEAASFGTPNAKGALKLTGTTSKLYSGNTVRITFTFARSGSVTLPVPIQLTGTAGTAVVAPPSGSPAE